LSSAAPHPPDGHRGQLAVVALADEQPSVRLDAELLDMGVEQGGQRGRAGHDTDLPAGALLEGALVAVAAGVGPFFAGVGLGECDAGSMAAVLEWRR
jgi:hypothetical protein